jgi:toxin ParE1/3/4
MNAFSISNAARSDLKNIGIYTQRVWGAKQRRIYLKGLDLMFNFLAENPLSGLPCNYIANGLRKHQFESHIVFYEKIEDQVLIIRILHKSMDVEHNF